MTPGELFVFSAVGGVVVSGVLFLVFSAFAGGLLVLVPFATWLQRHPHVERASGPKVRLFAVRVRESVGQAHRPQPLRRRHPQTVLRRTQRVSSVLRIETVRPTDEGDA